eukprot:TRINITY_DN6274_c1_g1_i1.p1 TRINITY_DN6274_c1_g1~~TRINITY_DN6274_c1_g1_i1.p1  ORF type:complete len:424 (+),score=87.56 TRINITY_DN6274_c1_g1_i1:108-1274(+)
MSLVGVKVQDGLFIGGKYSAHDLESATACKVTRVINCCGSEIDNQWEHVGVTYLTYNWEDKGSTTVLDKGDFVINEVYDFIEKALEREESVLIHSFNGENRCCCLLAAYLMKKYKWSLKKTTDFLKYRGVGVSIKMGLMQQLFAYEKRMLAASGPVSLAKDWADTDTLADAEEKLISNTYLNVQATKLPEEEYLYKEDASVSTPVYGKLKWADTASHAALVEAQEPEEPLSPLSALTKPAKQLKPLAKWTGTLQPILKGAASKRRCDATVEETQAAPSGVLSIQTRSRTVTCEATDIVPQRLGLKFFRSALVLEYEVPTHKLRAHHSICVDVSSDWSDASKDHDRATAQKLRTDNTPWLDGISLEQLESLVTRLRNARCAAAGPAGGS